MPDNERDTDHEAQSDDPEGIHDNCTVCGLAVHVDDSGRLVHGFDPRLEGGAR